MNDKVSFKDIVSYLLGITVLLLIVFGVDSDAVASLVGDKPAVILITKVAVGFVLSLLTILGFNLIFNPKSKKQLMAEAYRLSLQEKVAELRDVSATVLLARKYAKGYGVQQSLGQIAEYLEKLGKRCLEEGDMVSATQAVNLFRFFQNELNGYLPIVKGESLLSPIEAEQEINDTEKRIIPLALTVCQKFGSKKEQGVLFSKDVAEGSFVEVAKSLGFLDNIVSGSKDTAPKR